MTCSAMTYPASTDPRDAALPSLRRLAGLSLAGLSLLAVAGCGERRTTLESQPLEQLAAAPATTGWTALGSRAAWLRLPGPAGRPMTVSMRQVDQSLAQDIGLAGTSERRNHIVLGLHYGRPLPGIGPARPSEAGIRAELAAAFPGRAMRVIPQPRQNAFGPYGLAVASGPGALRCIYAWQWLDGGERQVRSQIGATVSWRARICRQGVTLDQIAADLDQIEIGPPASDSGLEPAPEPPVRRAPSVRPARAARERPDPRLSASTLAPGGQRYLAPVENGPAGRSSDAAAGFRSAGLDTSLPAEAYRGPTARGGQVPRPSATGIAPTVIVPSPN